MSSVIEELRKTKKIVLPLGKRRVASEGENRFKIYLPSKFNEEWRRLHKNKAPLDVVVVIDTSTLGKDEDE